jgi:hypothetical protein
MAARYVQLPDGRYLEWPEGIPADEFKAKAAPIVWQSAAGPYTRPPAPQLKPVISPIGTGEQFLKGFAGTIPNMIRHPLDTARSIAQPLEDLMPDYGGALSGKGPLPGTEAMQHGAETLNAITANPAYAAGGLASMAVLSEILPEAQDAAARAGSAIRDAAIGDPNVAALKGLRILSTSPKSLSTIRAVEGARPFLRGAQSQADLQSRIPAAKAEIWGPYKETVDALSGKQVNGPDGPTTVGRLEGERQQLSALNRQLKSKTPNPEALQLAQQKGLSQAQLLARERAVQNSLDPVLRQAGIDPKAIRRTFGQVTQIGERISGKSTLAETKQPYGFGKIANLSLEHPLQAPEQILSGLRDLVAGRPIWSGRPTDISLREAFRSGGPKPNFGAYAPGPPPLQLAANVPGNAPYGEDYSVGPTAPLDRPVRVPPPPAVPSLLPATAGESHPMLRYVEPPEPSTIRPMPPRQFPALPANASPGAVQPMIQPMIPRPRGYVEPFDPQFRPVNLEEYRNQLRNLLPPQQ